MSQSVRERISELAVLKTVGFRDRTVLGVVLSESILVILIGGTLGLLIGSVAVAGLNDAFMSMMGLGVSLSPGVVASAVIIMVATGIIAGIFPALSAMRLSIVDALARG